MEKTVQELKQDLQYTQKTIKYIESEEWVNNTHDYVMIEAIKPCLYCLNQCDSKKPESAECRYTVKIQTGKKKLADKRKEEKQRRIESFAWSLYKHSCNSILSHYESDEKKAAQEKALKSAKDWADKVINQGADLFQAIAEIGLSFVEYKKEYERKEKDKRVSIEMREKDSQIEMLQMKIKQLEKELDESRSLNRGVERNGYSREYGGSQEPERYGHQDSSAYAYSERCYYENGSYASSYAEHHRNYAALSNMVSEYGVDSDIGGRAWSTLGNMITSD